MPVALTVEKSAGSIPSGRLTVRVSGSSTPENIRPIPTPAANNIANQPAQFDFRCLVAGWLTVFLYQFLLQLMWHFCVVAKVHRETAFTAG